MNKIISLFIPPIFGILIRKLISVFRKQYSIGKIPISISPFYDLPNIQKKHRLYDRFLPILCESLQSDKLIYDIGANIGDTTIAIAQVSRNKIIAVEASERYKKYLKNNIQKAIKLCGSDITIVQAMIGTGDLSGGLVHTTAGTARLEIDAKTPPVTFTRLDTIVKQNGPPCLVKVDTDGFDFDVLMSGGELLRDWKPILFWENEIKDEYQLQGFSKLYQALSDAGYSSLCIFDNYGNWMFEIADPIMLNNLNYYLLSLNQYKHTRTFYYIDVLAYTARDKELCEKALAKYRSTHILK